MWKKQRRTERKHVTRIHLHAFLWMIPFVFFLVLFVSAFTLRYPWIGGDSSFMFRILVAGKWHFMHEGLSPFRFAPQFCGGIPLYGDQADMYYSLVQWLTFAFNPWTAMLISAVISMSVGYIGWYLVGGDLLSLKRPWAHLFALIVIADGFYFLHLVGGHVPYLSTPFLGWLFWFLFRPRTSLKSDVMFAGVFSLVAASIFYSGGYTILLFFALGSLLILPVHLFRIPREQYPALVLRASIFAVAATLLCSSKLIAMLSFLHAVPVFRPLNYYTQYPVVVLREISTSLWGLPQSLAIYPVSFRWSRLWELSNFLSPVTLVGTALGAWLLLKNMRDKKMSKNVLLFVGYVFFLILFFVQLEGGGEWTQLIHALPLFSSLRVTARFVYVFSLLAAAAGVVGLSVFFERYLPKRTTLLCGFSFVITIVAFWVNAFSSMESLKFYNHILPTSLHSSDLQDSVDHVTVADQKLWNALDTTAVYCRDDYFRQERKKYQRSLRVGATSDVQNGYYNMHNPACLQYPQENHCYPGENISVADSANFEHFIKGEPVTWKLSVSQHIADGMSLISLVLALASLLFLRGSKSSHPGHAN